MRFPASDPRSLPPWLPASDEGNYAKDEMSQKRRALISSVGLTGPRPSRCQVGLLEDTLSNDWRSILPLPVFGSSSR